jgi:DNA-binding response OmpR family regulator
MMGGGDSYITKPFKLEEMLVKVDAAMRRRNMDKTPAHIIKIGSLTLDTLANQAYRGETSLDLSAKEFAVLRLLAENKDKVIEADTLYERIWGQPMMGDSTALKNAVSRIRKKVEPTGYTIRNDYSTGYIFESI